ncbi:MAG TPA: hypothetical protein EYG71_03585 [Leucothrix sp.]|nr:hypothetical protein [Leucothrix sp.]
MRRTFHPTILFFILFFAGNLSANTGTDTTNIIFQVIVSETNAMQHCNYNYESNTLNVSRTKSNNCTFNHKNLLEEANQLASKHSRYKSNMNIVMLTITAP